MKKVLTLMICIVFAISGCSSTKEKSVISNNTINNDVAETDETQVESGNQYTNTTEPINEDLTKKNQTVGELSDKVIVIDAGHGINSYNKQEAIAPNTSETKAAFASGTKGVSQTEEQLNLSVALKLQNELEKTGAKIYMTRITHESDMTNIDRAKFANDLNADLSVKIHADGSDNSSIHGVSVLIPGTQYINDSYVISESRKAGECVLEGFVNSTDAYNRGISVRNDLTGFNWSTVPIILIEMGFMTNPDEDKMMGSNDYQDKMVQGIVNGIKKYFKGE